MVTEVYLEGRAAARVSCASSLIPAPGQYLLASVRGESVATLPVPIFQAGATLDGFLAASPYPGSWGPGTCLDLRGPLGRGFNLPSNCRRVALLALGETHHRLAALIGPAMALGASVVLICDSAASGLPLEVEVMPVASLAEAAHWADYLAVDSPRSAIHLIPDLFHSSPLSAQAQILLSTPMPCGGRGDCGVCAVHAGRGYKLICKDGPVLDLKYFR